MSTEQGYKRINFFKGFLTTEKDWNDAEKYHIDKRKLHSRRLHSPGVVLGYAGDLRVVARSRGDLSAEVQAGYAIDGLGNDLVLWDATIKNINPEEYRLPQTVYFVLRFSEELTDFIAYKENLEYKGHRRVLEQAAKVELSQTEPDIHRRGRAGPHLPGEGRHPDPRRARSGRPGGQRDRHALSCPRPGWPARSCRHRCACASRRCCGSCAKSFWSTRGGKFCALTTCCSPPARRSCSTRPTWSICATSSTSFTSWSSQRASCALDVDVNHPHIGAKRGFFRLQAPRRCAARAPGRGNKRNMEAFTNLLAYQSKASEAAERAVAGEESLIEAPDELPEEKPIKVADISDWEGVKKLPNPEASMDLEGITWVLVDEIDILDKESEKKHEFSISEAKDSYRSRQKLKYPDGTVIEGTGRAHVGPGSPPSRSSTWCPTGASGGHPAPHGLRVRRLRARVSRQRKVVRHHHLQRHRSRASLAQLAVHDRFGVRHRHQPHHQADRDHRRPRRQHVPHLDLSAQLIRR